jgi:anti-sigma B factor antagonist
LNASELHLDTRGSLDFRISSGRLPGDAHVVAVGGEVDLSTAPQLETRLAELVEQGAKRIIVDLGGASFIDSTVLGILLKMLAQVEREGGYLVVVCDDRRVLKVFEITGLDRVFRIVPSLTAAVQTMIGGSAS